MTNQRGKSRPIERFDLGDHGETAMGGQGVRRLHIALGG
jgi:hypothetical protein